MCLALASLSRIHSLLQKLWDEGLVVIAVLLTKEGDLMCIEYRLVPG